MARQLTVDTIMEMIKKTNGFTVEEFPKGYKVRNIEFGTVVSVARGRKADASPTFRNNMFRDLRNLGWTVALYEAEHQQKREARLKRASEEADKMNNSAFAAIAERAQATPTPTQETSVTRTPARASQRPPTDVDRIELLPFVGPIPPEVLAHVHELTGELAGKTFYLDLIDPAKAQAYLDGNVQYNRHVLTGHVKELQADMENDTWRFNGASVLVSPDGELNDGQHRMHATVRAGDNLKRPWPALVVSGITKEVFDTVDRGASRTLVNVLQTNGILYAKNLSGLVRRIIAWERGHKWFTQSKETMTYAEMFEKIMFERETFGWVAAAMSSYAKEIRNTNMNINAWGVLMFMCATVSDRETSEEFWGLRFAQAVEVPAKHSAHALRRRLLKNTKVVDTNDGTRKTVEMTYNDHIGFGIVAWNNYITDRGGQLRSPGVGWKEDTVNELELASLL